MKNLEYNLITLALATMVTLAYAFIGLVSYFILHAVYSLIALEITPVNWTMLRGFMVVPALITGVLIATNLQTFKEDIVLPTYEYEN